MSSNVAVCVDPCLFVTEFCLLDVLGIEIPHTIASNRYPSFHFL